MRISILLKTLSLVTLIVLTSCSTTKLSNGVSVYKRKNNKERVTSFLNNSFIESKISKLSKKTKCKKIFAETSNLSVPLVSNVNLNKTNFKGKIITKLNSIANHSKLENKCVLLILKNGDELSVKVEEINETQIKYRKCSNLKGPLYTKNKSDVLLIRYPDGTKDTFAFDNKNETKKTSEEGTNSTPTTLGVLGIISGIFIPLLGWILGGIGLSMWRKKPEKYTKSGKGWSMAAIVVGTLSFLFYLYVLGY